MTEEMLNSSFIIITHKHSLRIFFLKYFKKKVHLNFVGATKNCLFLDAFTPSQHNLQYGGRLLHERLLKCD